MHGKVTGSDCILINVEVQLGYHQHAGSACMIMNVQVQVALSTCKCRFRLHHAVEVEINCIISKVPGCSCINMNILVAIAQAT